MKVEIPNQLLVKVSGMISRGIKEAEINEDGILVFTLTDGTKIELGSVKGDQGPRGESGVYVGTGEMPEGCNVQIDPSGEAFEFIQPPKTASIGQALLVKSIDETGKPTEWETGEVKGGSGGGGYRIGSGLKLDAKTNTLSVDTADVVEGGNTKPITSAAVYTEVGNINALLATI